MSTTDLVKVILGLTPVLPRRDDPFPPYLAPKYAREGAIGNLAMVELQTTEIAGTFVRAALLDPEEDVRIAALGALVSTNRDLAPAVAMALSHDQDPLVRERALETLGELDRVAAVAAARRLTKDADPTVAALAREWIEGGE